MSDHSDSIDKKNSVVNTQSIPSDSENEGAESTQNKQHDNFISKDGQLIITEDIAKLDNVFKDPNVYSYYKNLYDGCNYECRHLLDPDFEWDKKEEKKVVRKLEYRVTFWACMMFMALQVDRGNLSQALSDNMLDDLNMITNEYNYGNTIFFATFLSAELPSQLISKKIGPDRWIPMQITLWSIVATCQCAITGKKSFYASRALLGLLEGGFIPDIVLWLSYFYTSDELPVRLSIFWSCQFLTTIFTSLLAFAILRMRDVAGLEGWRWLFLLEGLFTLIIGIFSFFKMPPSAVQTKTKWRPKGWFTDKEEKIVVNRVLRDDPSKGDMNNRQPITPLELWHSLTDYDLWPLYIIGLIAYIPSKPLTNYLTLVLKQLGFSTFDTNLLTIPYNILHIILLIFVTKLSVVLNERSLTSIFQPLWIFPTMAALRWWPGSMVKVWPTYIIATLLLGAPYIHAILVSWCSKNSNTVRARTVSASLYNMMVQLSSIISSNIYRTDDKPLYHRGNTQLFIINIVVIVLLVLTKIYYIWRNKTRDIKWNNMSQKEKEDYLKNTTDKGNKRLDFRFSH